MKGQITLDVALTGDLAAPRMNGTAKLAQGDIQDYTLGAHLSDVEALLEAVGDTLRIASLTAHAGTGTISGSGTVGVLAPGHPVDLKLTAPELNVIWSMLYACRIRAGEMPVGPDVL